MTCARSQKKNGRSKRNVHKSRWLVLILLPLIGCAIALAYPTHAKKVEETREEKQETALKQAREDQAREYQAQEVMSDLVQSHPHPVIRNTLNQLIVGREVGLLLKPMAGILPHEASFIVMPDERGIMRDILNYPTEYLLDPRTSKQHKQLVIYHEWIHYEQQKDRRFPTWLAEGKVPIPFSDDMRQIWFES
ncbi:MAG: hypothetical protein Q8R07_01410, partial [Candidatus Uhrbacteria bacterium]|nr:hypothetical protein [Candidatus Uhrbacteria bacterium]